MFGVDDMVGATLGSALIGGVGNVLGGIGSLFGQKSANDTNIMLAEQNRQWQSEENQKNRDWQSEMWNKQNEYNTPANQMKLLRDAGLNPMMYAADGSTSGAGASGTPSMVGAPNQPHVGALDYGAPFNFNPSLQLLQSGLQLKANVEEQHASAMEKIYNVLFDAYSKGGQKLYNLTLQSLAPTLERFDWSNSPLAQQLDNTIRGQVLENGRKEFENGLLEIEKKWSDTLFADKHLLNSDEHKQFVRTLKKIGSEINLINAQIDKTRAEKDKLVVEKVGALIDNGLKGLDFQIKKDVKDDIIDEYGFNADKAGYEALNSYKTAKYGTLEKLMPFGNQQELIDDPDDSRIYKRVIQRKGRNKLKHQ